MFQASSLNGSATHSTRMVAGVLALHVAAFWCLSQMPVAWRSAVATHPAITVFLLDSTDKPARPATPVALSQQRWPVPAAGAVSEKSATTVAPAQWQSLYLFAAQPLGRAEPVQRYPNAMDGPCGGVLMAAEPDGRDHKCAALFKIKN